MRQVIIYLVMGFFSLFILGFGIWTYSQSLYSEKIKKSFIEKEISNIKDLNNISLLSNKNVLLTGQIQASSTFNSRDNQKVVLERYKEEKETAKGWQEIKDNSFFKVIPFKLNSSNQTIIVDPYGLDKAYIGVPKSKIEIVDGIKIKKNLWILKEGQKVNILGNIENKSGVLVVNNPNLYKSFFDSLFNKEPFIITSMEKGETANKANEIGKSIYYSSFALFAVGIFFIFNSIINVLKHYKNIQKNF